MQVFVKQGGHILDDYRLYNIAYKHLLYSIHFGVYPSGSSLPPVRELCKSFGVSRSTIRSALKMLEEEQYISRTQGRSAIVTYTAQTDVCRDQYLTYCQSTKEALLDLSSILWLIWPEIMLQGLKLCGERELDELAEIAGNMAESAEYPYLEFNYHIIRQLGNPLLLNLYLSTVLFGHCSPTQLGDDVYRQHCMAYLRETNNKILVLRRAGNYGELKTLLTRHYHRRIETMERFYDSVPTPGIPAEPILYRWNYYTERPSVGFDLSMKLLREIYASYHPMDYLPSVAALSKLYGLPVITVRRAVQILNDIGVTESMNGKGTRVIVGSNTTVPVSRLSTPNMKKVLLPYLQSVQVILLICKDVAQAVFPSLPDSAVEASADLLREILASGDYSPAFGAAFELLLVHVTPPALREILGGLMHFQYLGYPLKDLPPNELRYNPRSAQLLLKSLEERDAELFAEELQRLTADIFRYGKEKLLAGGITEAKFIIMPLL